MNTRDGKPRVTEERLGDGYVLRYTACGLRVYGPDGVQIPGSPHSTETAMRLADRHLAKSKAKRRPCITCGAEFISAHVGHRMCKACRQGAARGGLA